MSNNACGAVWLMVGLYVWEAVLTLWSLVQCFDERFHCVLVPGRRLVLALLCSFNALVVDQLPVVVTHHAAIIR